jgi:hypothetical protein
MLHLSDNFPNYAFAIVGFFYNFVGVLYTPPPVANGNKSDWAERTNSRTAFQLRCPTPRKICWRGTCHLSTRLIVCYISHVWLQLWGQVPYPIRDLGSVYSTVWNHVGYGYCTSTTTCVHNFSPQVILAQIFQKRVWPFSLGLQFARDALLDQHCIPWL